MTKTFATNYPRNKDGLILFPRDDKYRKSIFTFWDRLGISLSEHPAKANMYLVQAIVDYVSDSGQTVMDIMSGTGTIMIASLFGRSVVCIELEDEYVHILEEAVKDMEVFASGTGGMITVIPGDCSKVLPMQIADHIIFSPPYSNIFKKKALDKLSAEMMGTGLLTYSKSPDNVGNLNEFLYHQKMESIYRKCFESLPKDGTLTIIIKDHIEKGVRMNLGERAKRDCIRIGFELQLHDRWLPPGSAYTSFMRARGDLVVDEEDVIVLRRPK